MLGRASTPSIYLPIGPVVTMGPVCVGFCNPDHIFFTQKPEHKLILHQLTFVMLRSYCNSLFTHLKVEELAKVLFPNLNDKAFQNLNLKKNTVFKQVNPDLGPVHF